MKHLDLFSGIGGFAIAAEMVWDDVEHIFCDNEPFVREVLKKHWPTAKIYDDIKTLDGAQLGPIDLITGGFPCQPFSTAGDRRGKEDDRDLWPEMFRVIKECRPAWVLGENVAGFVGMELDRSITDLEGAGYAVQAFDIPAIAVDARHIRHRVWIVAHRESGRLEGRQVSKQPKEKRRSSEGSHLNGRSADMAYCDEGLGIGSEQKICAGGHAAGPGGEDLADTDRLDVAGSNAESAPGRQDTQRSTGLRGGAGNAKYFEWPTEPGVLRVAHGIPNRVDRVESLGNAIVPQVAAEIMRAMNL